MRLLGNKIEVTEGQVRPIEEKVAAAKNQSRAIAKQAKATKVAEEKAKAAASWAVEEYKDSDAFEADDIVNMVGVYITRFNNYRAKITKAYPTLNLHFITASSILEDEKEEDEEGEEEVAKRVKCLESKLSRKVVLMGMSWKCRHLRWLPSRLL